MLNRSSQFPPIPRCLRDGPITVTQFARLPWWRRARIRANFRGLFFRQHASATLIINVRWGLSG